MNRIIIIEELHLSSSRIPKKVLQTVGGERLIDRGLRTLTQVEQQSGIPVAVVAWAGDAEIVDACEKHGVRWIAKSEKSSQAETWEGDFDGWQSVLDGVFDWGVFVNAVCHPFITAATIIDFANRAKESTWPWQSAIEARGQAWDEAGTTLIPNGGIMNTKISPIVRRPSHLSMGCSVADMYDATRAYNSVPEVFHVPVIEMIDIDTPADLEFARTVAFGLARRGIVTNCEFPG